MGRFPPFLALRQNAGFPTESGRTAPAFADRLNGFVGRPVLVSGGHSTLKRWKYMQAVLFPRRCAGLYPTLAALHEQRKLINKEIVALIAKLPDEFIARKGTYWRLGYNILEPFGNPYHLESHMDQMQAALDAARKK